MSAIAELVNVSKNFATKTVLEDVSLQIQEGEILALLGPNGSGKTTLLRILGLILRPENGEVHLHGMRVTDQNIEKMRMQTTMVFQRTVLFGGSVFENVAYGLRIRGFPKSKIDERVREVLRLVRLEGFEAKRARKLSGGEQQRVALARALALDACLLLLDEPTANLDPENARIIEEIVAEANRRLGTTIVMATHNMLQAKGLPHRVALIENGKIGEVETTAEVFNKLSKTLSSFAALENAFAGEATLTPDGTAMVDVGNDVRIETVHQSGGKVSIFISPEDIILSKDRFESSARNVLKGRIVEIRDLGSLIRLRVDVGKVLTVQVTKRSFAEMGLNLGAEVFLSFKASSVQCM